MIDPAGLRRMPNGRWLAQMYRDHASVNLGTYDTKAEAIAARHAGEKIYNILRGKS